MTQIYIDLLYRFQRVKINTAFSFWTELIQEVPQGPLRGLIQEAAVQWCSQESCSENLQQIYRRTPMPKCDFNTLQHECSPVNLLHIFRTLFFKNTSAWLLLLIQCILQQLRQKQEKTVKFLSLQLSYDDRDLSKSLMKNLF